jgi:predicted NUDIX family NTP pyrophosphohydrolase
MIRESAGILLHRHVDGVLQVLLAHPGGPYWRARDAGAWTLPKGAIEDGEDAETAARREFGEELGMAATAALRDAPLQWLARVRQRGGKWVTAFALRGEFDPATLDSNLFGLEWPPRSGRIVQFPELDRAQWFALPAARIKLLPALLPLLDRLEALLGEDVAQPARGASGARDASLR